MSRTKSPCCSIVLLIVCTGVPSGPSAFFGFSCLRARPSFSALITGYLLLSHFECVIALATCAFLCWNSSFIVVSRVLLSMMVGDFLGPLSGFITIRWACPTCRFRPGLGLVFGPSNGYLKSFACSFVLPPQLFHGSVGEGLLVCPHELPPHCVCFVCHPGYFCVSSRGSPPIVLGSANCGNLGHGHQISVKGYEGVDGRLAVFLRFV